jgi:hypothetical protein
MKITHYQKQVLKFMEVAQFAPTISLEAVERAVSHAVNCAGLDAKLNTPDFELGKLLGKEVLEHLLGVTGVQLIDQMNEEEQKEMFGEPNRGQIDYSDVEPYNGEVIR